ncbi:MAG: hypothetical protein Fur005_20380 [Roseiflexaceae bacterium]
MQSLAGGEGAAARPFRLPRAAARKRKGVLPSHPTATARSGKAVDTFIDIEYHYQNEAMT